MGEEEPAAKRRRTNNIEKEKEEEEEEDEKKADCISGLPDHLLHEILACLPTRIAVRTPLLSRRWRTVWTTSPDLSFTTRLSPSVFDSVLRLRDPAVPLRSFSLTTSDNAVAAQTRIRSWIGYATNNSALQHLKLKLVPTGRFSAFCFFRLPEAVFRLQHLRVLELCLPRMIPHFNWPPTAFLPSLQRLELADLSLSIVSRDAISNSCPALRYWRMSLYRGPPELDVNCPLLKVFELTTLHGTAGRVSICGSRVREVRVRQELTRSAPAYLKLSAPALRTLEWVGPLPCAAVIADTLTPDLLTSSVVMRPGALTACTDVNDVLLEADLSVLRVNRLAYSEPHITEVLGILAFDEGNQVNPPVQEYKNLKHLEFAAYFGGFGLLGVAFLLRKFSNIETMHISLYSSKNLIQNFRKYFKAGGGFGPGGYWDSHNIRLEKLVRVSVHDFSGERYEYDFLNFLLRTATSLREITISADCQANSEVILRKVKQLQIAELVQK